VKVTPLDIRRKEFKRSMRGYSDEEVDVFLDDVADEFERLFQENIELSDRLQRLEEQIAGHVQMKDALEKTLISAQLQSDEMKANARKESELILQEAELKARGIVNESYSETQRVQQALIQLKHLEEDFRFKFRSLLEGHLKLLNEAPIAAPATESRVLTAEAAGEAEPPLVVASPEMAGPEMAAPEMAGAIGAAMEPEAVVAEAATEADAAFEDEVPTEETETPAPVAPVAPTEATEGGPVADEAVSAPSAAATEESTAETVAALSVGESTAESTTAETVATETGAVETAAFETPESEEPTGGFFFGRQPDDIDDTFVPPEDEPEKARDFEW
jgi:cell division initiation protein